MDDLSAAINEVLGDQPAPAQDAGPTPAPAPEQDPDAFVEPPGTRSAASGLRNRDLSSVGPAMREPVLADPEQPQPAPVVAPAAKRPSPFLGSLADAINEVVPDASEQQIQEQRAAQFLSWRSANPAVDPAQAIDVLRYSEATGRPADWVAQNLDVVKRHVDGTKVDWDALSARSPALRDWLLANTVRPTVAKDDVGTLAQLEQAALHPWDTATDLVKGVGIGLYTGSRGQWQAARDIADLYGLAGPANRQKADQIAEEDDALKAKVKTPLGRAAMGNFEVLPMLVGDRLSRMLGGFVGELAAAPAAGSEVIAGGGPEDPVGDVGAVGTEAVGGSAGQFGGSLVYNIGLNQAQLYRELRQTRDANGELMDPDLAKGLAVVGGGLSGALLAAAGGPTGATGTKAIQQAALQAVRKSLTERGTAGLMVLAAKRFGVHYVTGSLLMAGLAAQQAATVEAAKSIAGESFEARASRIWEAGTESLKSAMVNMPLAAAVSTGIDLRTEIGQARADAALQAQQQNLLDAASKSATVEKLPTHAEDLAKGASAQPGAVQRAYIDTGKWDQLWQAKKADPREAAVQLFGDGGQAYDEAKATGGDLAMPAEKYIPFLRSDVGKALVDDTRLSQPGLTPRERRERQAEVQKRIDELKAAPADEMEAGARAVYEDFLQRAKGAGVDDAEADANARLTSAAMQSWAERFTDEGTPTTALDLYRQQDLAIIGPRGRQFVLEAAGEVASPGTEAEHPAIGEVREEFHQHLETPETEVALRRFYTDPVTGVRNERAAALDEADASRPMVLRFAPEGVKFRNDDQELGGHNKADELLRAVGQAAASIDPRVSRSGGDFELRVADEKAGQDFLEQLRKKLPAEAQGYDVNGAVHATGAEAGEALGKANAAAEAEGKKAPRGKRPLRLPEGQDAGTTIPGEKVQAEIGPRQREAFEKLRATPEGREQLFQDIHVEKATGLLTKAGFDARPKRAFRASIDLNGLKKLNIAVSKEFGNTLLDVFGRLAAEKGLNFDFAHDHGDEYLAQADSKEALDTYLNDLFDVAAKTELVGPGEKDGVTGTYTYKKLLFGFGTAEASNERLAEQELNRHKERLSTLGLRGNEDQPGRLDFVPEGSGGPNRDQGGGGHGLDSDHDRGGAASGAQEGDRSTGDERRGGDGAPGAGQEVGDAGADLAGGEHPAPEVAQAPLPEGGALTLQSKRGRGYIEFTPPEGGGRRSFRIRLQRGSDASTLAHETFHFLNEVMGDLAQRADAPQGLRDDYATLLRWMGYENHGERTAAAAERREITRAIAEKRATAADRERLNELTAREEKATHGWEQYLLEGRAPSVDLARPFARFRNWMVRIYKSIQGVTDNFRDTFGGELDLNDEVRGVFDRILASDAEVQKAQALAASRPFEALAAKMTPEERQAYEAAAARAGEDARTEMVRRLAEANRDENDAFFTKERERIRTNAARELDQLPAYRTLRYLQAGDMPETPGEVPEHLANADGEAHKLDRKSLAQTFGEATAEEIAAKHAGVFAGRGVDGISASTLADLLGWDSPGDLVNALRLAAPREQVLDDQVKTRMAELYEPALLDSPQALAEEALKAVHNGAQIEKLLIERLRLAAELDPKRAGHSLDLERETFRRAAENLVARRRVGELTAGRDGAAGYYLRAERAAAKRAQKAYEAGKVDEALAANDAQLLNAFAYRAARDARDGLETDLNFLQRTARLPWHKALGKADVAEGDNLRAYSDAHDAILQAIGLADSPDGAPPDVSALSALEKRARDSAQELAFDVGGLRQLLARPQEWRALTQADAQNVVDAVRNIRRIANEANQLALGEKRLGRQAWFGALSAHADEVKALPAEAYTSSSATVGEKVAHQLRSADAALTEIAALVEQLDNGDRDGPMHKLFIDARREARDHEVRLDKQVLEQVRKAFENVPKDLQKRMNEVVPGLSDLLPVDQRYEGRVRAPATRADLWTLFLNWGNAGNRQRVRDGNGWSDFQVQSALQKLTPGEATFLQGLLDTIQSLHPELAKTYERRTGLELGAVQAEPIVIAGKTYRGGYFPLRYDPRIARQGAVQEADVVASLFPSGYSSPAIFTGHTKARVDKVNAPVSMEFGTVATHLSQVIHDIAFGDWVRQAGSVVLDDRFREAVDRRLGNERTKLFMPWLRDIANDRAGSAAGAGDSTPGFVEALSRFGRSRVSLAVMGANFPSMIAHLTDPLVVLAEGRGLKDTALLGKHIVTAYLKVVNPATWGEHPEFKLSKEIAYREAREHENLRSEFAKLDVPASAAGRAVVTVNRAVQEVAFRARYWLDAFHNRVIWLAGYQDGLAKGMTQEAAARRGDDLLANALPSGDVADKAAILRSKKGVAAVVMFYGYANKMYNLWLHRPVARARDAWSNTSVGAGGKASAVADLAAKWIVMGAIGSLGGVLAGRGPKDDEDKAKWAARRLALEPLNTVPLIGSATETAIEGRPVSVRTSPDAQLVVDAAHKIVSTAVKAYNGEGADVDAWTAIDGILGTGTGMVGQVHRMVGYLGAANQGAAPVGPLATPIGLMYGPPKR